MRDVIVTGGTGALGRAVVSSFLEHGRRVIVPFVDKGEHDQILKDEKSALDEGRLVLLEADVAEESGAAQVVSAADELEVLVNGVGGFAGGSPLAETGLDDWDRMYRLNVRTAAAMSRAAVPALRARSGGSIVCVASQAAWSRPEGLAAYAASKASVMVLVETLQKEVAKDGIRVNAVVPSTIDTPANRKAMADADFSTWTPPEEIARVLLWLASDAAKTVRGALVPV